MFNNNVPLPTKLACGLTIPASKSGKQRSAMTSQYTREAWSLFQEHHGHFKLWIECSLKCSTRGSHLPFQEFLVSGSLLSLHVIKLSANTPYASAARLAGRTLLLCWNEVLGACRYMVKITPFKPVARKSLAASRMKILTKSFCKAHQTLPYLSTCLRGGDIAPDQ